MKATTLRAAVTGFLTLLVVLNCSEDTEKLVEVKVTDTLRTVASVFVPPDTVIIPPDTVILPPDTIIVPPDTVIIPPDTVITPPDTIIIIPDTPPFPPDGVFSVTGDGLVSIYWNPNWEDDLAGYGVYRNDEYLGLYHWLSDVPVNQTYYHDTDVTNGETWYYGVTAFDSAGLESDLSYENVFDTPRPEGFGLVLMDYLVQDDQSGWDFDTETRQASGLDSTDVFFGFAGGVPFIFTNTGVDIQDYGLIDLIDVDWAPLTGWAPSGRAEVIVGHCYVVRIGGPTGSNYAKIEVKSTTAQSVTLDWAYQTVVDLPELAPGQTQKP